MELLQKDIEDGYRIIHKVNEIERANVQSKQMHIVVGITAGAALAGWGLGIGLFATYAASQSLLGAFSLGGMAGGGVGGFGIGEGLKKFLPRRLFGSETALSKTIKHLKESRKKTFSKEITTVNNTVLPDISSASDSTASSSSEVTSVNTDTMFNSAAHMRLSNTTTFTDPAASMQNSTALSSDNIESNTTTTYEFTTPADRYLVAEFLRTNSSPNHFEIPEMIYNTINDFILRLRPRWK